MISRKISVRSGVVFTMLVLVYLVPSTLIGQAKTEKQTSEVDALPNGSIRRFGTTRFRHGNSVGALAVSRDGKTIASRGFDGSIRVWEASSGKELARLPGNEGHAQGILYTPITFSADGKTLLVGGISLSLWDWSKDRVPVVFASALSEPHFLDSKKNMSIAITSVAMSADQETLAWSDFHGNVRVWRVAKKEEILRLPSKEEPSSEGGEVCPVTLSPNGKLMAFADKSHEIQVWDLAQRKAILRLEGHKAEILALQFSSDGKTLASASRDESLRLWTIAQGRAVACHTGAKRYCSIAFSNDGQTLVSTDGAGVIRAFSPPTGKLVRQIQGPASGLPCVILSPDGKTLFAGGEDEALWSWDFETGKQKFFGAGHHAQVRVVTFSPDGRLLATASDEGTVRLWDPSTGKETNALVGHQQKVRVMTYSPDGALIATGSDDGTVRLWNAKGDCEQKRLFQAGQRVYRLAFCMGGRMLASVANDSVVRFWDTSTGKEVRRVPVEHSVNLFACSSDGRELSVGVGGKVIVLDCRDGVEVRSSEDIGLFGSTVEYSQDGRLLAVSIGFGAIYVYEVATSKVVRLLEMPNEGLQHDIESLAFVKGGRVLAIATNKGYLTFWDLPSGKRTPLQPCGCGRIFSLAGSPDGRYLASGNQDTTALLWKIPEKFSVSARKGLLGLDRPEPPTRLSKEQCETFWDDLDSAYPSRAFDALWGFANCPTEAVPYLQTRLKPVRAVDSKAVDRSIAELASEDDSVRKKAFEHLKVAQDLAVPALTQRLAEKPPLDERLAIEKLIEQAKTLSLEQIRPLRALQILEIIRTAESTKVLEGMAAGALASRITQAAKESLVRLAQTAASASP